MVRAIMINRLKNFIKKFIPRSFLTTYHRALAVLANVIYRFPSRKLIVIGVTGTKGKSSTVLMLARILQEAGFVVGSANTIFFKIGDKEWPNNTKQGMLGRFRLQKLLRQMVRRSCTHAVIEVTSEGISQSRHWGIAFDVVVFTNLSPEHIESHGSFAAYRQAKAAIFRGLHKSFRKNFGIASSSPFAPQDAGLRATPRNDIKKVIVANRLDDEANYFLQYEADEKWGVWGLCQDAENIASEKKLCAEEIQPTRAGMSFVVDGQRINLHLSAGFMVGNAMLAMAAARALGISLTVCKEALEKITVIPGRAEFIDEGQNFKVIVDYAHEPLSFETILKVGREIAASSRQGGPPRNDSADNKVIVVFGATGGGRDKAKRPVMGKIADEMADRIILTTDDPYDEDPAELAKDIIAGFSSERKSSEDKTWRRIVNRREAIKHAFALAHTGDVVLLLGKGAESVMAVHGGKFIPWSDREIARELLELSTT